MSEAVSRNRGTVELLTQDNISHNTFINLFRRYFEYSTDGVVRYAPVLAIQMFGHAMGYKPVNLIQPKEVHHNIYTVLVGDSTLARKTTAQDFAIDMYPEEDVMATQTSPERMMVALSENPKRIQFLGEFSMLLKGINGKGYMSTSAEIYNDLHKCPRYFKRELMSGTFEVRNVYLSVSSTITPQMLKKHMSQELAEGGFLARFLMVYGVPNPRQRGRLSPEVVSLRNLLEQRIRMISSIDFTDCTFQLSDKALAKYNEIETYAMKRFDKITSFAGRYMNYVISFADILMLDNLISTSLERGDIHSLNNLTDLIRLIELTKTEEIVNPINSINSVKSVNSLIVDSKYVELAWDIIKPCLEYAETLVDYIYQDVPTARLSDYLKKVGTASRSVAMQYTHNNANEMDLAQRTLVQRGEIEVEVSTKSDRRGTAHKEEVYTWLDSTQTYTQ